MKRVIISILAVFVLGLFSAGTPVSATTLGLGDNELFFNNFEIVFTPDAAGNYVYKKPGVANPVAVGDIFMGIINVQNIDLNGVTNWFSTGTDQITGVFLQQVVAAYDPKGVTPGRAANVDLYDPAGQTDKPHLVLGPASTTVFDFKSTTVNVTGLINPAANEIFALYANKGAGTTPFETNGSVNDDIAKATDGALWLTVGYGPGADLIYGINPGVDGIYGTPDDSTDDPGYLYSHSPQQVGLPQFVGEAYGALNAIRNNTGTLFNGIADINETEVRSLLPLLKNDMVLTSEVEANPGALAGRSPWDFRSNDPATMNAVPEPGTIVLVGCGLLGVAAAAWRKRKIQV